MGQLTNRLFGKLKMNWPEVLLLAIASAILTTVFLTFPVFKNTSFERMGVHLEAWIFLAVIIMSNCEKPLESALKTFMFFLISQPLIYLFQVPFSSMGFGLFRYYPYWFKLTLITFPAAYIGWYIRKKNWLSLLILLPVLTFLAYICVDSFQFAFRHFPYRLVTAVFCLLQVILYLWAFTSDRLRKLIGFLVPLALVLVLFMSQPQVDINATVFLPDEPVLSESASVKEPEDGIADITIESTGTDSMIHIHSTEFGTMDFSIRDGDAEYAYTVTICQDSNGSTQIDIKPVS